MDLSRPYGAICPTLDGDVLYVLAGTSRPVTGREVSRLAGRASHTGVRNVLNRLVEQGLVERQEAGSAMLYTLNREHLAAPIVALLTRMRPELQHRLRAALEEWTIAPIHVSMFGSAARGDGDVRSDIDLLVIRPLQVGDDNHIWREQLDALAAKINHWTGNRASIVEVGETEVARLRNQAPLVVQNLLRDAVSLYGPDVAELLSGEAA